MTKRPKPQPARRLARLQPPSVFKGPTRKPFNLRLAVPVVLRAHKLTPKAK
jgi:hypothetical protein